jgi:hypothetical protein
MGKAAQRMREMEAQPGYYPGKNKGLWSPEQVNQYTAAKAADPTAYMAIARPVDVSGYGFSGGFGGGFGGGGGYGSGGYGPGGYGAGGNVNFEAQADPNLEALLGRYNKYLDDFEGNTGHILDLAGQKMRDAREGGRKALTTSEGVRGVGSSNRMGQYEADTQRGVAGAVADAANARLLQQGNEIRGGLGLAEAPGSSALREKMFGLSAAQFGAGREDEAFRRMMESAGMNRSYANDQWNQLTWLLDRYGPQSGGMYNPFGY